MCGIFAYFCSKGYVVSDITTQALKTQHRGPDTTQCIYRKDHCLIFHRLAVNGLSPESNQPLVHPDDNGLELLCNGEIYNYKELIEKYNITNYKSSSDCEIILHLYKKIGFLEMVKQLDGEFAMCLIDHTSGVIHIARDPYGVRSLYISSSVEQLCISSEFKSIYMRADTKESIVSEQFPSGHTATYTNNGIIQCINTIPFYRYDHDIQEPYYHEQIVPHLRHLLTEAVKKRLMCDRKTKGGFPAVGAYLSGGFDSSSIAALLQDNYNGKLHTFSIGFTGSPDLIHAQIVADWIGSEHTSVVITEQEALAAIPEVITQIESYDTTSVRASVFMYLLSKYIQKNHPDIIVMYSGEGSDEASGSYLYFCNAPGEQEFKEETERLMKELHWYDGLRCDKSTAAAGLEVRVPFLDLAFIKYYMGLHPSLKMPCNWQRDFLPNGEKYLLRLCMTETYGKHLLPDSIIWRGKEALSDGVSHCHRSWSKIIQEHVITNIYPNMKATPVDAERKWYIAIFNKDYTDTYLQEPMREPSNISRHIPHYWLPKWCGDVTDPSARILSVYK